MTDLWRVPVSDLGRMWPAVEPEIARATARSRRYTPASVRAEIEADNWQLWVAVSGAGVEAVCCTRLQQFPETRVMFINLVAGHGRESWIGHLDTLEDWARAEGCSVVATLTRPGWERVLKDYTRTRVMLEKEL